MESIGESENSNDSFDFIALGFEEDFVAEIIFLGVSSMTFFNVILITITENLFSFECLQQRLHFSTLRI